MKLFPPPVRSSVELLALKTAPGALLVQLPVRKMLVGLARAEKCRRR
jgi:hypothetical protein